MKTTIILPVSRPDYLQKVMNSLEYLECDKDQTNLLVIVDGDERLYLRTRNLVNGSKFNSRLTVRSKNKAPIVNLDIPTRRRRITSIHNQARELIEDNAGYVFLIEDDTTFNSDALKLLMRTAESQRACGVVTGVELARWGTKYLGVWRVDDIYETNTLETIENVWPVSPDLKPEPIDASGFYCCLIKTDVYKAHPIHSDNGLGPDVNFGLDLRRLGFENFVVWQVSCTHYGKEMGKEIVLHPSAADSRLKLTRMKNNEWYSKSYKTP